MRSKDRGANKAANIAKRETRKAELNNPERIAKKKAAKREEAKARAERREKNGATFQTNAQKRQAQIDRKRAYRASRRAA